MKENVFYSWQKIQLENSKCLEHRETKVAYGASVNAVYVLSPIISMLESLYLPRVISRSGTTPSPSPPPK